MQDRICQCRVAIRLSYWFLLWAGFLAAPFFAAEKQILLRTETIQTSGLKRQAQELSGAPKKNQPQSRPAKLPCVLTIAGSDSGGGAGIQADLKTFAALGTHGASAICAVTAQNPSGVKSIQGIRPQVVMDQIAMVLDGL